MRRLLTLIDRELTAGIGATDSVVLASVSKLKPPVATPDRKARAQQLLQRNQAAQDMLNRHDYFQERAAVIAAAAAGAESIQAGGAAVPVSDIPIRFEEARQQARAAMLAVGAETIALYTEVAKECLTGVHRIAEERVQTEREEAASLGLPYQPSGVAESLWQVRERLTHQLTKLEGASPRPMNPTSLLGPLGLLPLPKETEPRQWPPPRPTPPPDAPPAPREEQLPIVPRLAFEERQASRQAAGADTGLLDGLRRAFGGGR